MNGIQNNPLVAPVVIEPTVHHPTVVRGIPSYINPQLAYVLFVKYKTLYILHILFYKHNCYKSLRRQE